MLVILNKCHRFTMKVRDDDGEYHTVETTVSDYFREKYQLDLTRSSSYPCLDLGKPRKPTYVPLEVLSISPDCASHVTCMKFCWL